MNLLRKMNLKKLVLLSWVLPGALVVCASVLTFLALGWNDYQSSLSRVQDDLEAKAKVISRRLSAELLLGSSGAVDSVSRVLEHDLGVAFIRVRSGKVPCARDSSDLDSCAVRGGSFLTVIRRVEFTQEPHYIEVSLPAAGFWSSLNPTLVLWSALPLSLLLGLGLAFQGWLLERYLVRPIGALVDTTVHAKNPPSQWPDEIQDISRRLAASFEDRDQAVFGRIAGGVIHDLKTLLQSIRIGQELAHEAPVGSEKRQQRLDSLLKTVSINVPKMLKIIELTLDGSREIPVRRIDHDLSKTIQSALEANEALAKTKKVSLEVIGQSVAQVPHDSIQLERALGNLIKNGIESFDGIPEDARIEKQSVRVSLGDLPDGGVVLSVEDSGPGLPHGTDRAFRILRSSKPHGSGLGLTVTRKIIEAHGGTVEAGASSELSGAAFSISLPGSDRGLA